MSLLTRFARQWIAGETLSDAIDAVRKANRRNTGGIINFLGEHVKDKREAEKNKAENLEIIRAIKETKLNAALSIKLTQLGLGIDKSYCLSNVEAIVRRAGDIFVWIDMEGSAYTDDTIDIYLTIFKKYKNAGIAVQSNLKRSESDIHRIALAGGIIRIVKGAYKENREIAYLSHEEVTLNFSKLIGFLFYRSPFFAVATHDDRLVNEAIEANKAHQKKIEFQMLFGVREELKNRLVSNGSIVADYIPYGKKWLPYSLRRIGERKRNILLIFRSIFDI